MVDRAIVVSSAEEGGVDFATQLGGMSLLARAAACLERAGLRPVALVGSPRAAEQLARERGRRLRRYDRLRDAVDAPALVLRCDRLVAPAIIAAMRGCDRPACAVVDGLRVGVSVVDRETVDLWDEGLPPQAVAGWHADARNPERALRQLLEDCRKPVDGIVARHLNRPISLFITRQLVARRAITPNLVTAGVALISLAGAAAAARGGYRATVAGAALMQLGSVLDGVDGELARLRHEESPLGAWLDTISDDMTNVAFWAALGLGSDVSRLRRAGLTTAAANALAALVSYAVLARAGSGDRYAIEGPPRKGVGRAAELMLKQDFFLLATLGLALAGRLHDALPLMAGGALVTLGASVHRAVTGAGLRR